MSAASAALLLLAAAAAVAASDVPYFIKQCSKSDPQLDQCLTRASNFLCLNFRRGIPELGVPEVEPIIIDEISVALGSGPDGYRATFKDIEAFGVSNLTVTAVRSDVSTLQFQLSLYVPRIRVRASYRSSGLLMMVRASGGGDYWGEYDGVKAKIYFRGKPQDHGGRQYMQIEDLKLDFSVKDINMGIENIHNGNAVLQAAINLLINSNAQELLAEMKPALKAKLIELSSKFMDNMFARVPLDMMLTD